MHYLTGTPVYSGEICWHYGKSDDDEGIRIGFSFHSFRDPFQRRNVIARIEKLLTENNIDWIIKRPSKWMINLDKAKKRISETSQLELDWLTGTVAIEPEFETEQSNDKEYRAVFAFYITREVLKSAFSSSSYIADEVITKLIDHLRNSSAIGVVDEFIAAMTAFYEGNYKSAIQESQKALESAIKTVIDDDSPAGLGDLQKKPRKSNLLPSQYVNFADNFIKLIGTVNAGRSQPGGAHGQGSQPIDIDPREAELILNLTAVLCKYLIKL